MTRTSEITGFYKLSAEERLRLVKEFAGLTDEEAAIVSRESGLPSALAGRMVENSIGTFPLPLGIATNFMVNGRDYLVPMAIEEPSVIAAASHAAKLARPGGGFTATTTPPVMIGQVQVTGLSDPFGAKVQVLAHREEILQKARECDPTLMKYGGGPVDVEARVIETAIGPNLIVHLLVDCRDAMGANAVNTMCEAVAPLIERITGGRVCLRILSNLADHRLARARAVFRREALADENFKGEEVVDGIVTAHAFAAADPYRCATHNKGVMNGIDAVVIATGNDWRAVEAGAHAYAAVTGRYLPLTRWEKDRDGNLVGSIELPLAAGLVGGATAVHPVAKACTKLLGVRTASELAQVIAAVGLAQNFAAIRALATEGIQRGHMSLHARNIAITAGAQGPEVDMVADMMARERRVRMDRATEILEQLRKQR